jgi:hypothetical protein
MLASLKRPPRAPDAPQPPFRFGETLAPIFLGGGGSGGSGSSSDGDGGSTTTNGSPGEVRFVYGRDVVNAELMRVLVCRPPPEAIFTSAGAAGGAFAFAVDDLELPAATMLAPNDYDEEGEEVDDEEDEEDPRSAAEFLAQVDAQRDWMSRVHVGAEVRSAADPGYHSEDPG